MGCCLYCAFLKWLHSDCDCIVLCFQWKRPTHTSCGETSSLIWKRPCRRFISEKSPGLSNYVSVDLTTNCFCLICVAAVVLVVIVVVSSVFPPSVQWEQMQQMEEKEAGALRGNNSPDAWSSLSSLTSCDWEADAQLWCAVVRLLIIRFTGGKSIIWKAKFNLTGLWY